MGERIKTFRVPLGRGGKGLTIIIAKKNRFKGDGDQSQSDSYQTNNKSGLMPVDSRPDDLIPRRRKDSINFYDLGQIKIDGVFQTLDVDFIPEVTIDGERDFEYLILSGDIDAMMEEIEDIVFSVPFSDWKSKFYKIVKGDISFEKTVRMNFDRGGTPVSDTLNNLPEWTSGGLSLSPTQLGDLIVSPDSVLYHRPLDFTSYKVTSENDPDAEGVEFTPSGQMDIFIWPSVVVNSSTVQYRNGLHTFIDGSGTHSDEIMHSELLNGYALVFERGLTEELVGIDYDGTSYEVFYDLTQMLKQLSASRGRHILRDFAESPPYDYSSILSALSPSSIPFSTIYTNTSGPTTPSTHVHNESFGVNLTNLISDRETPTLIAVIKKGPSWFYMWNILL